jgi:aspartate racemase
MKTIGIIGGMSWVSTAKYYQWLNEGIQERLGGNHSARLFLSSVQWQTIQDYQQSGQWEAAGAYLAEEARKLERAGADVIILATNTMHKVAPAIEAAISVPFLHLADATGDEITAAGLDKIALLGTRFTMTEDFYKSRLTRRGIDVLVPHQEGIDQVNHIIFNELCRNTVRPESKAVYIDLVRDMFNRGAQGVIFGCTEITMLIGAEDFDKPVFDTTRIHVQRALDFALSMQ